MSNQVQLRQFHTATVASCLRWFAGRYALVISVPVRAIRTLHDDSPASLLFKTNPAHLRMTLQPVVERGFVLQKFPVASEIKFAICVKTLQTREEGFAELRFQFFRVTNIFSIAVGNGVAARVVDSALNVARIAPVQVTAHGDRATEFQRGQSALHLRYGLWTMVFHKVRRVAPQQFEDSYGAFGGLLLYGGWSQPGNLQTSGFVQTHSGSVLHEQKHAVFVTLHTRQPFVYFFTAEYCP